MPGWRSHTVDFVDQPIMMELVQVDAAGARWVLLWMFVAVVGAWQLAKWPRFLMMAIIIAAATCLLVEPTWISAELDSGSTIEISESEISDSPYGDKAVSDGNRFLGSAIQAVFLGLLTSLGLRGVLHWPVRFRRDRLLKVVAMVVALGLVGIEENQITMQCHAKDANSLGPGDGSPKSLDIQRNSRDIQRLLIPVNPEGKVAPKGEVYVPELLYHKIFEPSQQALETAQWVLTAAHYRGLILEQRLTNHVSQDLDTNRRQYVCGDWKLSFDITSFRPNCKWILPLKQGSAQWFENEHRLDGHPWRIEWLPEDGGCQVLLPQPGAHRLEIVLRPQVTRQPRSASLRVAVPAVAGATLDLQLPAELTGLHIPHATSIEHSPSTQNIHALLQPADAIEVGWTPAYRTVDASARWNADELTWLKVGPSRIIFDIKLRIADGTGPLPILQLDTDPQLELLPLAPDSPIDDLETFMGNPKILQITLRPEIRTPVEIPLRFEVNRHTPIGRIAYPQLRLVNVATSRRLLAVSVAAGLSYEEQSSSVWNVLSPSEFMAQWGDSQAEPLFAYVLSNHRNSDFRAPLGSLNVRPDPQSFTAKLSLELRCGLESTAVRYQARMDSTAGQFFIHRLEVPKNLQLAGVQIQDLVKEETIDARWAVAEKSGTGKPGTGTREVTVFLSRPVRGPHELTLHGNLVQQPNVATSIPRIVFMQADASPTQVEIFRAPNVLVDGSWFGTQQQQDSESLSADHQEDVLVDAFLLAQHDQKVFEYTVSPNDLRFSTECLTLLEGQEEEWSATFWVQVYVLSGVVDRFSIEVPETWIDPVVVGGLAHLRPLGPDASQRGGSQRKHRYEIRLKHPLAQDEQINLKITGRLELETDQLARMPHIQVIGSSNLVRYLALPRMARGQSLEWQRRGLQQTVLPRSLRKAAQLESTIQTYLVFQNGYLAEQRLSSPAANRVTLSFAELQGAVSRQGEWAGTAMLVLHPGRFADCQLQLPPHSQLLQLSVGEQTVPRIRVGTSGWQIGLGPPSMPRIIRVSYTTTLVLQGGVAQLWAPQLLVGGNAYLPSSSYWKILIAGNQKTVGTWVGEVETGQEIHELAFTRQGYLRSLQSLEELGSLAFQLPSWEAQQWFIPWQSRIEHAFVRWKQVERSCLGSGLPNERARLSEQATLFGLSRGHVSAGLESMKVATRKNSFDKGPETQDGVPPGTLTEKAGTLTEKAGTLTEKVSPTWNALFDALGHPKAVAKNHFAAIHSLQDSEEEIAKGLFSRTYRKSRFYTGRSDGLLEIRLSPSAGRLIGRGLLACLMVTLVLLAFFMEARFHDTHQQTALLRMLPQILIRIDGPHGMMLAFGLVWWFWLVPSVVGFAVVVVTGLSLARRLWLTRP